MWFIESTSEWQTTDIMCPSPDVATLQPIFISLPYFPTVDHHFKLIKIIRLACLNIHLRPHSQPTDRFPCRGPRFQMSSRYSRCTPPPFDIHKLCVCTGQYNQHWKALNRQIRFCWEFCDIANILLHCSQVKEKGSQSLPHISVHHSFDSLPKLSWSHLWSHNTHHSNFNFSFAWYQPLLYLLAPSGAF